jgi:hypothetical protein
MPTDIIKPYPLCWPAGWKRNHDPQRSTFITTIAKARDGLLHQLRLLGARDVVISTNGVLLSTGEIAGRQPYLEDTGVAVYFTLDGQQRCVPCDKYVRLEDNLHAAELTIEALRGLERWGSPGIVAAAFQGFQALPSGEDVPWWRVLEVEPTASEVEVEAAYRRLAKATHPDAGGNREGFERVQAAYQAARDRRSA